MTINEKLVAGTDERPAHDEYNGSGAQHHLLSSALLTSLILITFRQYFGFSC